MSQITHFCGVKLLAGKYGCVKFWTNIMSATLVAFFNQMGVFLRPHKRGQTTFLTKTFPVSTHKTELVETC